LGGQARIPQGVRDFLTPPPCLDDEAYHDDLLFSCPDIIVVGREYRFSQLLFISLQDLMCCRAAYRVALVVYKCRKIAAAAAAAAARQEPR
jgi:hypothetical protein